MGLLWVCRKVGALVHGIGDIWTGALLEVVELANDAPVVKTCLVVRWCIVMVTQELAGCCQCGLGLGTVGLQSQFFEDAVNQVWLGQVDCLVPYSCRNSCIPASSAPIPVILLVKGRIPESCACGICL